MDYITLAGKPDRLNLLHPQRVTIHSATVEGEVESVRNRLLRVDQDAFLDPEQILVAARCGGEVVAALG